jgi:hypothetical protein
MILLVDVKLLRKQPYVYNAIISPMIEFDSYYTRLPPLMTFWDYLND